MSFAFGSTRFVADRSQERLSAPLHRFGEAFFVEPFHSIPEHHPLSHALTWPRIEGKTAALIESGDTEITSRGDQRHVGHREIQVERCAAKGSGRRFGGRDA